MAAKPPGCVGCPLYGDGRGFVPDELRDGAAVFIVGQNPGADEEAEGRPFVGKTGQSMEKFLRDAGLTRDEVSIGNAIRCRWRGTNELPPITQTITKDALRHCWQAHGRIPHGTRLIVAQGDYAAVTLTGDTVTAGDKSTGWRGYLRPAVVQRHAYLDEPWVPVPGDLPVLLSVHLARLFREPWLTLPTRLDWAKIPRILASKWPRKPPRIETNPEKVKLTDTFTFDTEYVPATYELIRLSAASTDHETYVIEADDAFNYMRRLWPERATSQRWPLLDMLGEEEHEEDSDLPPQPQSVSGQVVQGVRSRADLQEYVRAQVRAHVAGISPDAPGARWSLQDMWTDRDGASFSSVAQRRPLARYWPHTGSDLWGLQHGLGFVPGRSSGAQVGRVVPRIISQYAPADVRYAQEMFPFGFLLEDTVWLHSCLWSDHPHDLNFLASLYGSYNRHKHLSRAEPILYSGLDALVLMEVWQALQRELNADPQSRYVWEHIDRPALPVFVEAQYHGLRVDGNRVNEVMDLLTRQATEATLRAQAIAGWPINLGSNPQVGHRIYEVEGIKAPRRG